MQVIIAQHQCCDLVLHLHQKRLALLGAERAGGDRLAEQNLDVDLMVRHRHAGRVVDRIGVDTPALLRVSDAAALGHAEIGTLGDHPGADRFTVDAQRVVGLVPDLGMGFGPRLDERADAAKEQQVDLRGQQALDQLGRGQVILGDGEGALHLGADRDRFRAPFEDAAARRDQPWVIIRPAR